MRSCHWPAPAAAQDDLHFLPPIYFELNQFMLNLVCTAAAPSRGSAQAAGGKGGKG